MKHYILIFTFLSINCFAQKPTIYTIGDSTMANKLLVEDNPERGWGQVLPQFFNDNVIIDNRAMNGRSTKSFIDFKLWDAVYNVLKPGDYVFIQFGHNDGKVTDSTRYTNPHTAYRYNLIRFVTETRKKGATPILFSSITRRTFNEQGVLIDSHGDYPLEMRLVAQEFTVPFIDLQYYTEILERSYGPEKSKKLHLHYKPGENACFLQGIEDNTHLSVEGATAIAKLAVEELKKTKLDLVQHIK
ncbi:rhamnogalacturonan acetylesterase [Flavobacterium sp. A45]|uniref:rhamnogalacturonan acetylesterase n=1 Tax=Flavobacterium sp. A45 TaxID=1945862 RepID=UPI0009849E04|nr:rhamnogalacturonan acetylesterase [Flavobacterium sp. A45]OOG74131.1 rhamnogalacturonan acetylesterase [Flavobacterium sp. A45]